MKKVLGLAVLLSLASAVSPLVAQPAPPASEEGNLPPPKPFPKKVWKPGWHQISYYLETFDEGPYASFQACQVAAKKNNQQNPTHNYTCVWENEPRAAISGPVRH
jgi:hypothetical protein